MSAELEILKDLALELAKREEWEEVRSVLTGQHPADLAEIISEAPSHIRSRIFTAIDDELKPDVLAELEPEVGSELLEALSDKEISEIVEEMEPDDAADLLADFEDERSEGILRQMDAPESQDVRNLLRYEEDSAGGIMTTSTLAMEEKLTVGQAIEQLALIDVDEPFYNVYVIDSKGTLVGTLGLWELIRTRDRTATLEEMAHRDIIAAATTMDQEEVGRLMAKYDLTAIPVVDSDGKLVGRITVDDVMDVMEEEASEDILRMGGHSGEELNYTNPIQACRARLPWLLITLATGFATSFIFKELIDNLEQVLVLSFFVPIVMAMGGNTGIQSSTLVIRGLAVGTMEGKSLYRIFAQELIAASIMGLICGAVIAAWATFLVQVAPDQELLISPFYLGFVVGISLFSAMVFAAIFGAFTPIVLNRFNIDPAAASGPFVTSSNDIFALLIYYAVTFGLITAAMHTQDLVL